MYCIIKTNCVSHCNETDCFSVTRTWKFSVSLSFRAISTFDRRETFCSFYDNLQHCHQVGWDTKMPNINYKLCFILVGFYLCYFRLFIIWVSNLVSNTITIQNNSTCELLAKLDREDFYYILQKPPGWTLSVRGWKLVAQQFFLKHLKI